MRVLTAACTKLSLEDQLQKMRADWDQRARENARHYVDTANSDWTDEEFFASGEKTVAEEILTDLGNICQGKSPGEMRTLEIGCGAGRVTKALARFFGEVHAVDVSGEMVRLAKQALKEHPNAFVYQNNGKDLAVVPDVPFDFAFSSIVFQHIPSREIIENYVQRSASAAPFRSALQVPGPGGSEMDPTAPDDTWLGAPFSERQAIDMAFRCGFDPRYRYGAGEQYFLALVF